MPPPDDSTRVKHILEAAQKAIAYTRNLDRSTLNKDELLSLAVVRLLEIIGEAVRGVSDGLREKYPEIPWAQMAGMRNRLSHAYYEVDLDRVWDTIDFELPGLVKQLSRLIDQEGF
jgi:uncharacterized protein with HEPN domain